jgi:hypothetical protein
MGDEDVKDDVIGLDWEVIDGYCRKDGLADGLFLDITEAAKEVGFLIPDVIITRSCAGELGILDDEGKLKDSELAEVLGAFHRKVVTEQSTLRDICELVIQGRTVWLHIGPNDEGQPCLTLMLPEDY